MKISDAIIILNIKNYNITNIQHISYNELKKYYHIQSLIYHPDKNSNNQNATLIFQNINNAFITLKELITNTISDDTISDDTVSDDTIVDESYNNLLINFINYLINHYTNTNTNASNLDDLKIEADKHLNIFLETLFSNFSLIIVEDIYLILYKFINNSNSILTNKIVSVIKKLCLSILEKNDIYIINPTISNLLNSDIYKLTISNECVYVPLWHNELAYENAIIKIYPILDSNIKLDNNTIHYTYKNKFSTLLENISNNINSIKISLDNNNYTININMLKITKYQIYILENEGIPIINNNNILDNNIKGSIIFHIHLE
jgi:DnaJ-class molecular chaperone